MLATVLGLLGTLLATAPAQAAVAKPGRLTPSDGESVSGIPVLTWDRVSGATSYDVQVATNPDFGVVKYRTTTTNRRVVPDIELPPGDLWWRVEANSPSGDSGWTMEVRFTRNTLAGPALLGPDDGQELDQPEDPALLSWEPVPGAVGYTVEIDDAADFINPTTYTTKTTSYVVPKPQIATTYHWRVRATLAGSVVTEYSAPRTYSIGGLEKPVLVAPADSALESVKDVVLDWRPVAGAATYDLQISTDENFTTFEHVRNDVRGTRYSPPVTLDNDQYFWRVRPVDTLGNELAWGSVDTWEFRRHWPEQPQLEHPGPGAVVGDPFFYQWTPVTRASHYTVEISETGDFSRPDDVCTTTQTTYTPMELGDCYPAGAGTYSWRVIAHDDHVSRSGPPVRTDSIQSDVKRFSYLPGLADPSSPADGSTVEIPTLSWDPVAGAAQYKVFLTSTDGGSNPVNGVTTSSTTFTPRKALTVGKTYRWWVQTVSGDGRLGPSLVPDAQPRFTMAETPLATATQPQQRSPQVQEHSGRFPGLTWDAVAGASFYKVGIRPADSIQAFEELNDQFSYSAGDVTAARAFGTYEWVVNAYDSKGVRLSTSPQPWTLTVSTLGNVTDPQAAMTGLALQAGDVCTAVLPARCVNLKQTPVLRWTPVPGAGGYRLYLSRDREMTNIVSGYPIFVDSSMWTPKQALIDSQAGDAFYWQVQPCVNSSQCNPVTHAPWAFNKLSNPVELTSPAPGATVADDVTFAWRDYLETNLDPTEGHVDDTGVNPRTGAMQYVVEVSTVPNFQSVLDKVEVDQTTYTAFAKAYPEGTLYWRVSVRDGSRNLLGTSEPRTFTKSSPVPELTSPTHGDVVTQTEAFRWQPLDFAASYDIEVYKNADTIGQPTNRVFVGNSKQVAFTTTTPLPASATAYTWRLRRVDASGNKGLWTDLADPAAHFEVSGTAPGLTSPTTGVTVGGSDGLFIWQPVAEASAYRFERRLQGSTAVAETVKTPALAWAPIKTMTDGDYEWRVSTLDADSKVTATSEWRSFLVDSTAPTVTRTAPTGKVAATTTFIAKFSESVTGVSTSTFRLFKKGVPDPVRARVTLNATGTQATLTPRRRLKRVALYTVKVLPGITDAGGNPLAKTGWKVRIR